MARAYAAGRGWHVLPLYSVEDGACNCWKGAACKDPGKHPRIARGFHGATTDPDKIDHWWSMWPVSNVGIATGAVSGLVVVDIDFKNGAEATLRDLYAAGKSFGDERLQVRTPGPGFHLYYRHPGGTIRSGTNVIGPGIDIRADGAYVCAPPSIGVNGPYYWQLVTGPGAL
jgi:hypothetical protein